MVVICHFDLFLGTIVAITSYQSCPPLLTLAHVKIWCNRDPGQKKETEFSRKNSVSLYVLHFLFR